MKPGLKFVFPGILLAGLTGCGHTPKGPDIQPHEDDGKTTVRAIGNLGYRSRLNLYKIENPAFECYLVKTNENNDPHEPPAGLDCHFKANADPAAITPSIIPIDASTDLSIVRTDEKPCFVATGINNTATLSCPK